MENEIKALLENTSALPALFIGSGLSMRYLGLPNWQGLLREFCIKPGFPYEYYYDKARRDCADKAELIYPRIADLIEDDFNEIWFTDPRYQSSRDQHQQEIDNKVSPLKICIADFIAERSRTPISKYESEINLFKEIGNKNIGCIITTNYDQFVEQCFGDDRFAKYIGQDELLFSTTYDVAEIYKIHGCCTKPDTIVINTQDYKKFQHKSAYLSAKILTFFLERTVIFIGYSLSDMNIRAILQDISNCLENDQLVQLSDRLVFVEWNDSASPDRISEHSFSFDNGKTIVMRSVHLKDFSPLYNAILKNVVKYDIKTLRRVKSQLYALVKDNSPSENLFVATDLDDEDENVEFVVGIGVFEKFGIVGYRGITPADLCRFALGMADQEYDIDTLLRESLPNLYRNNSFFPICQLIARCKDISNISSRIQSAIKPNFRNFLSFQQGRWVKEHGHIEMGNIVKYYKENGLNSTLTKIPLLAKESINVDDLETFLRLALVDHPALLSGIGPAAAFKSQYRKSIAIWDWLKFSALARARLTRT